MNVLPVIQRELRAESKRPVNQWLRLMGAIVLLALLYSLNRGGGVGLGEGRGGLIFGQLNFILFAVIWITVPLMTADCISKEKRDGTIGLLFLTPLRVGDVVIAKGCIHALRASVVLLAALPMMMIPVFLGGVTWMDGIRAMFLDTSAILLALSAGLFASSWARRWNRAMLLAFLFSSGAAILFVLIYTSGKSALMMSAPNVDWSGENFFKFLGYYTQSAWHRFAGTTSAGVFGLQAMAGGRRQILMGGWSMGGANLQSVMLAGFVLVCSLLVAGMIVVIAARRIRNVWQDESMSPRQTWWFKVFCTPVLLKALLKSTLARQLQRNPVGWLQNYSWSARVVKWGWCGFAIMAAVDHLNRVSFLNFSGTIMVVICIIGVGLAFSAVSSFRRERESGALELLLVTPLQVVDVIAGRMGGLARQFFPAYLVIVIACAYASDDPAVGVAYAVLIVVIFCAVSLTGLYFSMMHRNILMAWAMTCVVTLSLPMFGFSKRVPAGDFPMPMALIWLQVAIAVIAARGLRRSLEARSFVLHES